jgi:predicted dehydrogenase
MLRFEGDIVATVHSSFAAAYRTWFEVQGTAGILRVANLFRPQMSDIIELRRDDRVERIAVDGSASLFVREVEDFVAAALDGRVPALSLDESRTIAASLAALHRSVELRRPVQL